MVAQCHSRRLLFSNKQCLVSEAVRSSFQQLAQTSNRFVSKHIKTDEGVLSSFFTTSGTKSLEFWYIYIYTYVFVNMFQNYWEDYSGHSVHPHRTIRIHYVIQYDDVWCVVAFWIILAGHLWSPFGFSEWLGRRFNCFKVEHYHEKIYWSCKDISAQKRSGVITVCC